MPERYMQLPLVGMNFVLEQMISLLVETLYNFIFKLRSNYKISDKEHNIHDFDIELICEYFSSMDRQGPGSKEATLKALSFIGNMHEESIILDPGCGTGGQTIVLAQNTPGNITAIDLFPGFIDKLNDNAQKLNLQSRVKGVIGSMDRLDFQLNQIDLI